MFFFLSKAFFLFARPLHFILLLMLIGLGLQLSRMRRLGLWVLNIAAACLLILAFSPLAAWLEAPLETRFPRPGLLDPAPDGIIILGGALDADLSAGRSDFYALNDAGERLTEVPRLARLYPNAKIIYTGGPFESPPGVLNEAQDARRLLVDLGVSPDRITTEEHSLTTWENAIMSKAIVNPAPDSHWLLVTSAFHMPRSMGTFRKAGWPGIVAYPTDYRLPDSRAEQGTSRAAIDNLTLIEIAAKEWYGLAGYWLGGRSSALFPAP
jgi:uncharacterized SAM-binding protein YcdF (DUF218 family)